MAAFSAIIQPLPLTNRSTTDKPLEPDLKTPFFLSSSFLPSAHKLLKSPLSKAPTSSSYRHASIVAVSNVTKESKVKSSTSDLVIPIKSKLFLDLPRSPLRNMFQFISFNRVKIKCFCLLACLLVWGELIKPTPYHLDKVKMMIIIYWVDEMVKPSVGYCFFCLFLFFSPFGARKEQSPISHLI